MQDFGAADAIQDVNVEFLLPAPEDIGGQGFSGGDADAYGGEVEAFLCIWQGQHACVERWYTVEYGWSVLLNDLEHVFRQWSSGVKYRAGSYSEWEVEVVAEAIGEEEFGG